jgi:hypothetical protein
MCTEASAVLRAVAADFFFNCWYLEIPSDNRIRHISIKVSPLSCARLSTGNVLEFLCWKWKPYPRVEFRKSRLGEYCFIYEKFVACREP